MCRRRKLWSQKKTLSDPRKQHRKGKILRQTQNEPGLETELNPKADHGEANYRGSNRLEGRRALITGGDSGIGRAVAIAYAREGADVAMSYLPSERSDANQVIKEVKSTGRKAVAIPGDLTDEKFAKELVKKAASQLGGLDIIVNNAGKQIYNDDIAAISTDQLIETFTVNVFAMFWIAQEALKYLPAGATIINTSSIQATQPSPGLLYYVATKGAIANFSKGLAQQLTLKGIRVNVVAPGLI